MIDNNCVFLTFDKAIEELKANKGPGESFIGIFFDADKKYFGFYEIYLDEEDLDYVCVYYEGGYLFADVADIEGYSLDDVPDQAKTLFYKNSRAFMDIHGHTSEFSLSLIFADLPDADEIVGDAAKDYFVKLASDKMQEWASEVENGN